mgnify:CR=1 FL=1
MICFSRRTEFLLVSDRIEDVTRLLLENGYEQEPVENDHHIGFHKGKSALELHTQLAGMPEGEAGALLQQCLQTLYTESLTADIGSGEFRMPGYAHQAIVLLLHMQHHIVSTGLGLRHMMDWSCFVQKTAEEPVWQQTLIPLLEQIGLPVAAPAQPAAPKTADQLFEEKLKAFMSESDTKLSSIRADHRTKSRRR